jgi:hypothetical protein
LVELFVQLKVLKNSHFQLMDTATLKNSMYRKRQKYMYIIYVSFNRPAWMYNIHVQATLNLPVWLSFAHHHFPPELLSSLSSQPWSWFYQLASAWWSWYCCHPPVTHYPRKQSFHPHLMDTMHDYMMYMYT